MAETTQHFLSFTHLGGGLYNGQHMVFVHEMENMTVCMFDKGDVFQTTDLTARYYIRAYIHREQFFKLGQVWYSPQNTHHVQIDVERLQAFITDGGGQSHEHRDPLDLMALQAASAQFVFIPAWTRTTLYTDELEA